MLMPIAIMFAIFGVITAPGLIAQYLEERRAKQSLSQDEMIDA